MHNNNNYNYNNNNLNNLTPLLRQPERNTMLKTQGPENPNQSQFIRLTWKDQNGWSPASSILDTDPQNTGPNQAF